MYHVGFATEFGRMGFEGSDVGLVLRCLGVLHQVRGPGKVQEGF